MITDISFSTEPIAAGEMRELRITATEPIGVKIKCFVKIPPPPRYVPCNECGSFTVKSGEAIEVKASETRFQKGGGQIFILIRDAEGDTAEFKLEVVNWGSPMTGGGKKSPLQNLPGSSTADVFNTTLEEDAFVSTEMNQPKLKAEA